MELARIAIWFDPEVAEARWHYGMNVFEAYLEELLNHRGITYEMPKRLDDLQRSRYDLVLVALAAENEATVDVLYRFASEGGGVVLFANLNRMAARFGYTRMPRYQSGYACFGSGGKGTDGTESRPLRFLDALPWQPFGENAASAGKLGEIRLDALQDDARVAQHEVLPALLRFRVGTGFVDRWSVGLLTTIVGLQQGSAPLAEDGAPAPDGTASVNDGILKADDTIEMSWQRDRRVSETGAPYFAYPYADEWREVIIGHLVRRAAEHGWSVPYIGYWPPGVEAVAMISHDSDGNDEEHGMTTLELMKECGIRTTWCMIESGYTRKLYDRIEQDGHEIAFHYNAIDRNGYWAETEFKRQLDHLRAVASDTDVVSNKNHVTRFEGWGELFRWCEKYGIESDQTRGPSKKGNVGFLFGTCHPYRPIAWSEERNRRYNVLEIGFLTQDLDHGKWTDTSVIVPFLEEVRRAEGVAHFLFHQVHLHQKPPVREAFRRTVQEAKARGFEFWTGKRINDWERARRGLRIVSVADDGEISVAAGTEEAEKIEAVLYIPVPEGGSGEQSQDPSVTVRYGVPTIRTSNGTTPLMRSVK
ncbi:MAG: hypothetical protein K0Q94_1573 [Paenibacillus sp.]|jgi:peptidoglycan/xylan/chitin deacetylase (PgdA/CDA1 family)|nr:hypothetical protein [Paenibacillus sp.]